MNASINSDTSAGELVLQLIISADAKKPRLSAPESIYHNQETTFACSGSLGRKDDGAAGAVLTFEVQFPVS